MKNFAEYFFDTGRNAGDKVQYILDEAKQRRNFMSRLLQQTEETVAYIRSITGYKPEIAIVLGSGLGQLVEQLQHVDAIN